MKTDKTILQIGVETLQTEIDVLNSLKDHLGHEFELVVQQIVNCTGRVVITGIGKSALIGQKIVATFNSTGTPSLFMHAADAIHGDLGMITKGDIVICISKSGETPEIKVLVPFLKNFGNTIVAIVSNQSSFLGKKADYILYTPVTKEAEPNNLAPTASTTAQLAMGDAIASAVLSQKGFTANDFAKFHPGGSLGKYLYLKVSDISDKHESPKVSIDSTISTIILEMTSKRLGATAVMDNNKMVGIITDGDLRRMLSQPNNSVNNITAQDIMTKGPISIQRNDLAVHALELMRNQSISQLIVLYNDDYQGIIHLHDLIKEGLI